MGWLEWTVAVVAVGAVAMGRKTLRDLPRDVWLAFAIHFCLMAFVYIVKPLQDDSAQLLGTDSITALFRWSMVTMLVANRLFTWAFGWMPRAQILPWTYRFFNANLVLFGLGYFLSTPESMGQGWLRALPTCFFLWVGVVTLLPVSVFWSRMADQFNSEQSKLYFGAIATGASLGQLCGSTIPLVVVKFASPNFLFPVAALMLELAVQLARPLQSPPEEPEAQSEAGGTTGKPSASPFAGLSQLLSPYLLGICCYMFLYTFTSSFLYLQKQDLVALSDMDRAQRVSFFSAINLVGSVAQILVGMLLTGRLLKRVGVGVALAIVPCVTALGFSAVALWPGLILMALFEVVRKTLNYGISRPSREVLFTVVPRDQKYLAKNFIDTFIYRAGDALASFAFDAFKMLQLGATGLSWSAVPFSLMWLGTGLLLGKAQQSRAQAAQTGSHQQQPA